MIGKNKFKIIVEIKNCHATDAKYMIKESILCLKGLAKSSGMENVKVKAKLTKVRI